MVWQGHRGDKKSFFGYIYIFYEVVYHVLLTYYDVYWSYNNWVGIVDADLYISLGRSLLFNPATVTLLSWVVFDPV